MKNDTNYLKYHIEVLKSKIMKLNKICDEFDLLKEENVRLKKGIEDLNNKSELQEKRMDKDHVDISKEVFKSISKPVECQKQKKKWKTSRRLRKSRNNKKTTENVNLIDSLTKGVNDYFQNEKMKPKKVSQPHVFDSRYSVPIEKQNNSRIYGGYRQRNTMCIQSYAQSF